MTGLLSLEELLKGERGGEEGEGREGKMKESEIGGGGRIDGRSLDNEKH